MRNVDVRREVEPSGGAVAMLIVLVRHGIAVDRAQSNVVDAERPLTDRGIARTRRAARGLRVLDVDASLILTSPLVRATQTAAIVARELGISRSRVRHTSALEPEASPVALLEEILALDRTCRTGRQSGKVRTPRVDRGLEPRAPIDGKLGALILVGHAPHLDRFLAYVLAPGATPFSSLKKAGAACIEVDTEVSPDQRAVNAPKARVRGTLKWLLEPKQLLRLQ